MDDRILEPVGEIGGLAAFAALLVFLAMAVGGAGWAAHADVEVIVVAPPWPDLLQPAAVASGLAAERLLDCRIDEDALYGRLHRCVANDHPVHRRPRLRIGIEPIVAHHHDRRHLFAILA